MKIPRSHLKRVLATPMLWWRSKGFGIHSPSAYGYVRAVVNERNGYYAYGKVDALAREAGMSCRTARLLMRAALWERSEAICCMGVRPQVAEMVTAWSGAARVVESPGPEVTMMVAGGETTAHKAVLEAAGRIAEKGGTIVLLDTHRRYGASRRVLERWLADKKRPGVLMSDGRSAVLHVVTGVPAQTYGMRL